VSGLLFFFFFFFGGTGFELRTLCALLLEPLRQPLVFCTVELLLVLFLASSTPSLCKFNFGQANLINIVQS
jgi:hypothetical protein